MKSKTKSVDYMVIVK